MSAIQAAIEAAKNQAAAVAANPMPAIIPQSSALATHSASAPARRLSMEDVQPSMAVDAYIKIDNGKFVVDSSSNSYDQMDGR
jgi:hypothetical protein